MRALGSILLTAILASALSLYAAEPIRGSQSKLSGDGLIWLAYANTVSKSQKAAAVSKLDPILTHQMGAVNSIAAEKDIQLRSWMYAISGLAMNGHVVAAQNLVNEVAKTGPHRSSAFPVLKSLIEESTLPPLDDDEYQKATKLYTDHLAMLPKLNSRNHYCGSVLLKAELFDDHIARSFAKDCFIGTSKSTEPIYKVAENFGIEMAAWRRKSNVSEKEIKGAF